MTFQPDGSDVDRSYWAPDCFHPGTKGHYAIATTLWNNTVSTEFAKIWWGGGGDRGHCVQWRTKIK